MGAHEGSNLPTIAYFLSIAVRMFFNDHDPPHFHVRYQQFRAASGLLTVKSSVDGCRRQSRGL
jgi:hypothetical protein